VKEDRVSQAPASPPKKRFRLWITLSELVGVLALVIAGLNFWESHHERVVDTRRQAAADRMASEAHSAVVLSASVQDEGARLLLQPMNPAQAVQTQRYLFPHAVLGHAMEVDAARPQINLDWIADGLRAEIVRERKAGMTAGDGEGELPVGLYTTYVEDGAMRSDTSLYRLGYAWRSRLLGGPKLTLEGLSLVRRAVPGDLRKAVEAAWERQGSASTAS
jgi:hypothetical protein